MGDTSESDKLTPKDRYKLAIEARNFHYDNFSKWLTYFYVAIGALFVAYYSLPSNPPVGYDLDFKEILILILGYIISLFWYWSCKGYYYWNIHWIRLIQYYEEKNLELDIRDRIYSVFRDKSKQNNYWCPIMGANISTSKIAILFSFVIAICWGCLLIRKLILTDFAGGECKFYQTFFALIVSIVCTVLFGLFAKFLLSSDLKDMHDLEQNRKNEII